MRNIYILCGDHQFNALEGPAELIAEGLRKNGAKATVVNLAKDHGKQLLVRMLSEKVDLVMALGPIIFLSKINGRYLHEIIKAKFAILFLDNPIYSKSSWSELFANNFPDDSLLLFLDAKHERQFRGLLNLLFNSRFVTQFFPWGGHVMPAENNETLDRRYDLVIFCTVGEEISNDFKKHDKLSGNFSEELVRNANLNYDDFNDLAKELTVTGFNQDVVDIICAVARQEGPTLDVNLEKLVIELDSFLKRYRRIKTFMAIKEFAIDTNLRVGIYGTGWTIFGSMPNNIHINGPVPYQGQFDIFMNSKAILNVDPNWTEGVHDRVFNAFGAHCVAITNENLFTATQFQDSVDCCTYTHVADIPQKINYALENYSEITASAYQGLLQRHSWQDRCLLLFNYLNQVS